MPKLLEEIHPGEILLEDFMKPMGISARQLAADIDVSPSRISELVNGQRPITADTEEVRPGVMLDLSADGQVLGIEMLDISRRTDNPREMAFEVLANAAA